MTDVNPSAPLPAIQIDDRESEFWVTAVKGGYHRMATLAHLVQVLKALPDDQRDTVLIETLRRRPVPKGERCVALAVALTGGPTAYGELTTEANKCRLRAIAADERAEQEKARADRAQQALAVVAAERDQLKALVATFSVPAEYTFCEFEGCDVTVDRVGELCREHDEERKFKELETK